MKTTRIQSLDGLRGIAAFVVVIHHVLLAFPEFGAAFINQPQPHWAHLIIYSPLHLLLAGQESVIVFFILSGFVLSGPFWKDKALGFVPFAVKRLVRLYPTYLAAVIIGIVVMTLLPGRPWPGGTWISQYWTHPADADVWLRHVGMAIDPVNFVDAPIWSLVVEVQASLLFPLMIWLMRKLGLLSVPAAILMALIAKKFELAPLFYYEWLFVLGAEISRHRALIVERIQSLPLNAQWLAFAAALLGIVGRWWLPIPAAAAPLVTGFSGAYLIAACLATAPLNKALSIQPIQWLGKVSYSLYLTHFVLIMAAASMFYGTPWWIPAAVLIPPVSLVFAWVICEAVEQPSIAAANASATWVRERMASLQPTDSGSVS